MDVWRCWLKLVGDIAGAFTLVTLHPGLSIAATLQKDVALVD